jgi:hypothetical protein
MVLCRPETGFPISEVLRYFELGPIWLVTSAHGATNIPSLTMGWHTVMEFTRPQNGCAREANSNEAALCFSSQQTQRPE